MEKDAGCVAETKEPVIGQPMEPVVVVAPVKNQEKDTQPVVSDDASTASPKDDDVRSESSIPSETA